MPQPSFSFDNFRRYAADLEMRKSAAPPGTGTSAFPDDRVSDGTGPIALGARARENERDVRASVPDTVDELPEPGPYPQDGSSGPQGSSRFPDDRVSDGTGPIALGARARENERDVRASVPDTVDELPEPSEAKLASMPLEDLLSLSDHLARGALAGRADGPSLSKAAAAGYGAAAEAEAVATRWAFETVESTIKEARYAADRTADYLEGHIGALLKMAEDEGAPGADADDTLAASIGASGMPPGGGVPPGAGAPPGGGGPPLAAAAAPDAGASVSPQEALPELLAAAMEMGVTPDQIVQFIEANAGGGAPAAPMGAPPDAGIKAAARAEAHQVAVAMRDFARSGEFEFEPSSGLDPRRSAIRKQAKAFLAELFRPGGLIYG